MSKTNKNEFNPDYNIETVIMGKADIDTISNLLAEIDTGTNINIEEARRINNLVLQCQTLICNWTCPRS